MKIFVFGNLLVKKDAKPLKILPKLKKEFPTVEFIVCDPNEECFGKEKELIIMDTVLGLDKVALFNSLEKFSQEKRKISPHSYDLLMNLKFLEKLGKIRKVKIIGLPLKFSFQELVSQIKKLS